MTSIRPIAWLAVFALGLTGCASSPNTPRVLISAVRPATSLMCWYVESDDFGKSGYACVDGAIAYPPANGGGLFVKLETLIAAIHDADLLHPVILNGFRGELLPGWRVRSLTPQELAAIQPALQRS